MAAFLQVGEESFNVVSYNKKNETATFSTGSLQILFPLQHDPNSNVHDSKIWDLISYQGSYFGQTT